MHAALVVYDLHVPQSRSLKARRAAVKPVTEGLRRRFSVSVAEVAGQDTWQRAGVAVAAVASSAAQLNDILDAVDRFVWSHPEIEVLSTDRRWLDAEA
jgi:uncharacterized protein YlxP (DUF503 family)